VQGLNPSVLEPKSVQATLDAAFYGVVPPLSNSDATADLREFLRKYDVQAVIAFPEGARPANAVSYFATAIGCPVESGGVTVWLHVQQRLLVDQTQGPTANDTCGVRPFFTTRVLTPANGATVSGTRVIAANGTDYS
jgi:hypothetical protein